MNNVPKISIDIFDSAANISFNQEFGTEVKTIKIDSLVKAFNGTDVSIESPILPLNTIQYKEKGNSIIVITAYPQCKFNATYKDIVYENCIRPNLVLKFELNKNNNIYNISNTICFGLKDDLTLLTSKTKLYDMPFPNIGNGGWVCWGANSISGSLISLTGLNIYINRLFNSPFNNHLFKAGLLNPFGIHNVEDFFKFLQNKETFPREILINTSNNLTLGDL